MFSGKQNKNETSALIQPTLEIGQEDDEYEKETNATADKVMRMSDGSKEATMNTGQKIQAMHSGKPEISKMHTGEKKGLTTSDSVEKGIESSKGSGENLPQDVQSEMGQKLGTDLSDVNIHTGSKASEMNKEIGAKAFTHGNDIYFNNGQYNLNTNIGKHLLVHELTHTVQQSGKIQKQNNPKEKEYISGWYFLPADYDPETESVVLYTQKEGIEAKTVDEMNYVTTVPGLGEWKFDLPEGQPSLVIYIFRKKADGKTEQLRTVEINTNTQVIFKKSKEIVKGQNWEGSAYQKVFDNLNKSSGVYKDLTADYTKYYNLEMNYAKKENQLGIGLTTTKDLYDTGPDHEIVENGTVSTYFNPEKDTKKLKDESVITLNDLGRALTIIHEGVHARLMLDLGYEGNKGSEQHDTMSYNPWRTLIVDSLKEFVSTNKFIISDNDLELISWYGLLLNKTNLTDFQDWVNSQKITDELLVEVLTLDLNDKNKVQPWVDKVNERIESIIYNTAAEPDRYMIK